MKHSLGKQREKKKSMKLKAKFFEMINNTNKPLARLRKKKKIQINKIGTGKMAQQVKALTVQIRQPEFHP